MILYALKCTRGAYMTRYDKDYENRQKDNNRIREDYIMNLAISFQNEIGRKYPELQTLMLSKKHSLTSLFIYLPEYSEFISE
jgi:hypothetical protein